MQSHKIYTCHSVVRAYLDLTIITENTHNDNITILNSKKGNKS